MLSKSELIEQLQTGVYNVTFTKVNGDKRVMPCTLMASLMPVSDKPIVTKDSSKETDSVSVWCTDKDAWRAFKPSALISFERLS